MYPWPPGLLGHPSAFAGGDVLYVLAPWTDRITPGCTWRRRASFVHIQAEPNRQWLGYCVPDPGSVHRRLCVEHSIQAPAAISGRDLSRPERTRGAAGERER
jgi:hypothetical protein